LKKNPTARLFVREHSSIYTATRYPLNFFNWVTLFVLFRLASLNYANANSWLLSIFSKLKIASHVGVGCFAPEIFYLILFPKNIYELFKLVRLKVFLATQRLNDLSSGSVCIFNRNSTIKVTPELPTNINKLRINWAVAWISGVWTGQVKNDGDLL
jgi:hypothetical protein